METETVNASQLVSDSSPEIPATKTRKKLYAEDFPGVTIQPAYPGANHGRHPLTKQFVSLKPKPSEQSDAAASPAPSVQAATVADILGTENRETPQNTPAQAVEPDTTEAAEAADAAAEDEAAAAAGSAPDFSDLPNPADEPETETQPEEKTERPAAAADVKSYRKFVGYLFDSIVAFLSAIFGAEWLPESASEKEGVVSAWVDALMWMGARVLNPLQLAYAATAAYCFTRLGTLWTWWKRRKNSAKPISQDEPKSEPAAEAKPKTETENASPNVGGFSGAGR
jgi:hypothetical protein